jgi:hypothetical protein
METYNVVFAWYEKTSTPDGYIVLLRNICTTSLDISKFDVILQHNLPLMILPKSSFVCHTRCIAQELEEYIFQSSDITVRIVDACIQKDTLLLRTYREADSQCILTLFKDAHLVSQAEKIQYQICHTLSNIEINANKIQKCIVYMIWNVKDCKLYENIQHTTQFLTNIQKLLSSILGYGWRSSSTNTFLYFFNYSSTTSSYHYLSEYLNTKIQEHGYNPVVCCFGTDEDVKILSTFTKNIIHISVSFCKSNFTDALTLFTMSILNVMNLNVNDIPIPSHLMYLVLQVSYIYPRIHVSHMGFQDLDVSLHPHAYGFVSEFDILERLPNVGKVLVQDTEGPIFQKYSKILQYNIKLQNEKCLNETLQICKIPTQWKNEFLIYIYPSLSIMTASPSSFPLNIQIEVHTCTGKGLSIEVQNWIFSIIQKTEENNVQSDKDNTETYIFMVQSWLQYTTIVQYCIDYIHHNENVYIDVIPVNVPKHAVFPLLVRIEIHATKCLLEFLNTIQFNIMQILNN